MLKRSLCKARLIIKTFPLVLAVILLVMIPMTSSAIMPRRTTHLKNSPIYYIAAPLMHRSPMAQITQTSRYVANPFTFSQFYKLPIQYLSNAKPIDIMKGITKTTPKKVISNGFKNPPSRMSNLIYLPLTYLSNAKPIKVMINPFGKR